MRGKWKDRIERKVIFNLNYCVIEICVVSIRLIDHTHRKDIDDKVQPFAPRRSLFHQFGTNQNDKIMADDDDY